MRERGGDRGGEGERGGCPCVCVLVSECVLMSECVWVLLFHSSLEL